MSRRLRFSLFGVTVGLLVILFAGNRESRQRELDRDLFVAVYGEDPSEVARTLRLGADPNSRLGAKTFTWFSRLVLRLQGNPLWNDPRIDQAGCLLIYVEQKQSGARSRIGRILHPRPSASSKDPQSDRNRLIALKASVDRLSRIHEMLVASGAHK